MGALIKLVIPPFVPVNQPSLGVSSLVAVLKKAGFSAEACYLNLDYLEFIGEELYTHLGDSVRGSYLSGEFLFSPALADNRDSDWQEYEKHFFLARQKKLREVQRADNFEQEQKFSRQLGLLYEKSAEVITRWAKQLLKNNPQIIGFSTTFQQTAASLALARKVKEFSNNTVSTVFGGANCRGDMGQAILDNYPWVDHVVSGEGEGCIAALANDILNNRITKTRKLIQADPVTDMDSLPVPDFHDYFARYNKADFDFTPHLVAESSRGCWWGSKSHCTFCGLNGENLSYRHKSPQKIVSEIKDLNKTYQKTFFMMTDNILHRDVASALHGEFQNSDLRFFYEVKANLSKKQLIELAQTGIHCIQPGIENLSTPLLKRINKGTSQLQNIQTIKQCTELNFIVSWNIIYKLPGETEEDCLTNCTLIPKLFHLIPPSAIPMRLERFSSYWQHPERYKLEQVHHSWPYDFIFKHLPKEQRSRLATYFEYESPARDALQAKVKEMIQLISQWRAKPHESTLLHLQETFNGSFVIDSRSGKPTQTLISTPERELLLLLDSIISFDRLLKTVQKDGMGGEAISKAQLYSLLQVFTERDWVISENNNWLSLVIDPLFKNQVYL